MAKYTTLEMVLSNSIKDNQLGVTIASLLGVDRQNFKAPAPRRQEILISPIRACVWVTKRRAMRHDQIPDDVKSSITMFWHEHTRTSPIMKDKIKSM